MTKEMYKKACAIDRDIRDLMVSMAEEIQREGKNPVGDLCWFSVMEAHIRMEDAKSRYKARRIEEVIEKNLSETS